MAFLSSLIAWLPILVELKIDFFPIHILYYTIIEVSYFFMISPSYVFWVLAWVHYGLVALATPMIIICLWTGWDVAEITPREELKKKMKKFIMI